MTVQSRNEKIFHLTLFALSCLNVNLITIYLIIIFFLCFKGSDGFLKMCILYTFRQVFYIPGLATITSSQINLKLVLYTIAALIEIFRDGDKKSSEHLTIILFGFGAGFSSLMFGSFPIAGTIKVVSFTIVFYAICLAINSCKDYFDTLKYLYSVFCVAMTVSFCLILYRRAYLWGSAGWLFRGIWNHPNDFGVACSIFLALILVYSEEIRFKELLYILCTMIMIYLSKSRGAMIASFIILLSFAIVTNSNRDKRKMWTIAIVFLISVAIMPSLRQVFVNYFGKSGQLFGGEGLGAFQSREDILNTAMNRFLSSPLFGRGLLISYIPGVRDYRLLESGTEPGTIFLEVLGGTGIIGVILFSVLILAFFHKAKGVYRVLTIAAVFASISEVSFFSVNNYAVIYYVLIGCSVLSKETENIYSISE